MRHLVLHCLRHILHIHNAHNISHKQLIELIRLWIQFILNVTSTRTCPNGIYNGILPQTKIVLWFWWKKYHTLIIPAMMELFTGHWRFHFSRFYCTCRLQFPHFQMKIRNKCHTNISKVLFFSCLLTAESRTVNFLFNTYWWIDYFSFRLNLTAVGLLMLQLKTVFQWRRVIWRKGRSSMPHVDKIVTILRSRSISGITYSQSTAIMTS